MWMLSLILIFIVLIPHPFCNFPWIVPDKIPFWQQNKKNISIYLQIYENLLPLFVQRTEIILVKVKHS